MNEMQDACILNV